MATEAREPEMKGFTTFTIWAMWQGGGLTPASIGKRFLGTLDRLGPLSRAMDNWVLGDPPSLGGCR